MRYAIYFTPPEADPLTRAAASWLGRSPFEVGSYQPREAGGLSAAQVAYLTAAPRRYGFHATIKAPFRLMDGAAERELDEALTDFCGQVMPFELRLTLGQIDGFFALVPDTASAALDDLARNVVVEFEPFRAPLSDAEIERRSSEQLSPGQLRNLHRWGYPHVMEDFRFHMTLTGRVAQAEAPRARRAIEAHFGPLLDEPLLVGSLALFIEPEPGAPFSVRSLHGFGAALAHRKSA